MEPILAPRTLSKVRSGFGRMNRGGGGEEVACPQVSFARVYGLVQEILAMLDVIHDVV